MLKRASNKLECLSIEGSEIYAIKPSKATWDAYMDRFSELKESGATWKTSDFLRSLYRECVRRITNVETDEGLKPEVTDPNEIVDILCNIQEVEVGRKIDDWLIGMNKLSGDEAKNSNGEPKASSLSPSSPTDSTVSLVSPPASVTELRDVNASLSETT